MTTANVFAEKLLQIKALQVKVNEPFVWASGWHSPVYCDNRKALSYPHVRDYIKSELANAILEKFPEAEGIAGVATAGIPHGALVADLLRLPFLYVRNKPKGHGLGNQIEGVLNPKQKIVVIEDLVSTGKSSLEAVSALRSAGADVIGLCALFTYGFPQSETAFKEAQVPLITLSNYTALMEVAESRKLVSEADRENLHDWRLHPDTWGK